uniref:Uncharacterized protein n=1 Tax=Oryza punctata TaxID=4537 RepID=A0A0E0MKZ8_ORYPU
MSSSRFIGTKSMMSLSRRKRPYKGLDDRRKKPPNWKMP